MQDLRLFKRVFFGWLSSDLSNAVSLPTYLSMCTKYGATNPTKKTPTLKTPV